MDEEYDGLFKVDAGLCQQEKLDKETIARYDVLREKITAFFSNTGDKPRARRLANIASWLLLNFSSGRARKHYKVETPKWRLEKKTGQAVSLYHRHCSEYCFTRRQLDAGDVGGLIKELLDSMDGCDVADEATQVKYNTLKTIYKYLIGSVIFDGVVASAYDNSYGDNKGKYMDVADNISITLEKRYVNHVNHVEKTQPRLDIYQTTKSDDGWATTTHIGSSSIKVNSFEYNNKSYDIRDYYARHDEYMAKYCADVFAKMCWLFVNHAKVYPFMDYPQVKSILRSCELVSDINKYEQFFNDSVQEFKVFEDVDACAMMLNMADAETR